VKLGGIGLALLAVVALWPALAGARTVEVHLVIRVDLQRLHPNAPPDEPLEPAPALQEQTREVALAHPAFQSVTTRVVASETPPNPRVPADFLRLVDAGVDEVVVVDLTYHARLDSFRASGVAGIQGHVAIHSVAGRRKVLSRSFTVGATYPGDVTKEAVLKAERDSAGKGAAVPIEEIELGLLDGAVKERLAPELRAALRVYRPGSLPEVSRERVEDAMRRMARFLEEADRREEAAQVLQRYLERYPDASSRPDAERRLRRLKQTSARDPAKDKQRQEERAANHVVQSVTAAQLAETFEKLVGSVVEVRAFRLDWRDDGTAVMTPVNEKQSFIVKGTPPAARELEADPDPIYVMVVGREPLFLGVKVPVVRWVGCPKGACPK
jgi:hypothetical protein